MHTVGGEQFDLPGVKLDTMPEAYILNGHSYDTSELVDEKTGMQIKLRRAYEVKHTAPIYDDAFNFPELDSGDEEMAGDGSFGASGAARASAGSPAKPSGEVDKLVEQLRQEKNGGAPKQGKKPKMDGK